MIHIKVVSTPQELNDALSVRRAVFVHESKIEAKKEFDGNDFSATHILAYVDNKPAGTLRLRYFKDFIKIERCCLNKDFRKTNLSRALMSYTYAFCAQKGYHHIVASCKKELLPRWQKDGFVPIKELPEFTQNNMTLIPIYKKVENPKDMKLDHISYDTLNQKDTALLQTFSCPLIRKDQKNTTPAIYIRNNGGYDSK